MIVNTELNESPQNGHAQVIIPQAFGQNISCRFPFPRSPVPVHSFQELRASILTSSIALSFILRMGHSIMAHDYNVTHFYVIIHVCIIVSLYTMYIM